MKRKSNNIYNKYHKYYESSNKTQNNEHADTKHKMNNDLQKAHCGYQTAITNNNNSPIKTASATNMKTTLTSEN